MPTDMAIETTSTTDPDVPTTSACDPVQKTSRSLASTAGLVELNLSMPSPFLELYPLLSLDPYHPRSDSSPSNILAFVQNAAKKEIADLVTAILPGLQYCYSQSAAQSDCIFDPTDLQNWWRTFMRFIFFVAEIEDDVVRRTTQQDEKLSKRLGEYKRINKIQRLCKSLEDKYSFTMEVVFRAADMALKMCIAEPNGDSVHKASMKLKTVCHFMLDTMDLSKSLVAQVESFSDLQINKLEQYVIENLFSFTGSESHAFVCVYTRWLEDEKRITQWMHRHCGVRGRLFGEKWRRAYGEGRGRFVSELHALVSETR